MSVGLYPFTEFKAPQLAAQLREAVTRSDALLRERYILGPIARYGGDLDQATTNVEAGQNAHRAGLLGHFAAVGDSGDVVGSGSIDPYLKLRKLRVPMLPPGLVFGPLAVEYPYATPNVQGWIRDGEDGLDYVYADLVYLSRTGDYHRQIRGTSRELPWHIGSAWTLEPLRSPADVHRAIRAAGLQRVATRRFDDEGSRRRSPPRSTLYAQLNGRWRTAYGKQRELRIAPEMTPARRGVAPF